MPPLPPYIVLSVLRKIESSGKLYKNYHLADLLGASSNPSEFGDIGSDRREDVSKKLSSIRSYSVESYFKLIQKHSVDPGPALQKELKKLQPINLDETDIESKEDFEEDGMW